MRHQWHGGKWSEDEVQAKRLRKHETTIWTNGETYQSPIHAPSCEKYFDRIKSRLEACYNGSHSGQNDHQEEQSDNDFIIKERSKQEYDVLLEGKYICPRRT